MITSICNFSNWKYVFMKIQYFEQLKKNRLIKNFNVSWYTLAQTAVMIILNFVKIKLSKLFVRISKTLLVYIWHNLFISWILYASQLYLLYFYNIYCLLNFFNFILRSRILKNMDCQNHIYLILRNEFRVFSFYI